MHIGWAEQRVTARAVRNLKKYPKFYLFITYKSTIKFCLNHVDFSTNNSLQNQTCKSYFDVFDRISSLARKTPGNFFNFSCILPYKDVEKSLTPIRLFTPLPSSEHQYSMSMVVPSVAILESLSA